MLAALSGRTHDVITAVALRWEDADHVADLDVARSRSARSTRGEIERYVATGEPFDKAGGYAIQGRAAAFVARLEGSYSGVMGLPLAETAALARADRVPRAITSGNPMPPRAAADRPSSGPPDRIPS